MALDLQFHQALEGEGDYLAQRAGTSALLRKLVKMHDVVCDRSSP